MTEPWLSADDIAAHLGVTKDTVYAWIAEKALLPHRTSQKAEVADHHNVTDLLGEDLKAEIAPGSKVRIAASTFSISAGFSHGARVAPARAG